MTTVASGTTIAPEQRRLPDITSPARQPATEHPQRTLLEHARFAATRTSTSIKESVATTQSVYQHLTNRFTDALYIGGALATAVTLGGGVLMISERLYSGTDPFSPGIYGASIAAAFTSGFVATEAIVGSVKLGYFLFDKTREYLKQKFEG